MLMSAKNMTITSQMGPGNNTTVSKEYDHHKSNGSRQQCYSQQRTWPSSQVKWVLATMLGSVKNMTILTSEMGPCNNATVSKEHDHPHKSNESQQQCYSQQRTWPSSQVKWVPATMLQSVKNMTILTSQMGPDNNTTVSKEHDHPHKSNGSRQQHYSQQRTEPSSQVKWVQTTTPQSAKNMTILTSQMGPGSHAKHYNHPDMSDGCRQ